MNNPRSTRRRMALTIIAVLAVVAVFTVRLIDIQVVRASELSAAAVSNRSIPVTTYGTRGEIVDTNGVVLADSVDRFDITVSPMDVGDFDRATDDGSVEVTVAEALAEIGALTGQSVDELMAPISADPEANFAYLTRAVKLDVFTDVRELGIPWVSNELRQSRTYPNGAIGGNLVGFIGTDGPQAGIETTENECLASTNGTSTYERGADGVRIPGSTVTTTEPKDGGKVTLTIDRDLQWFAQEALGKQAVAVGADWATAVVVRIADGHLMAVADWPSVDPNDVNSADVGSLGSLAFSTPYEPGSTFKPMTVASLLDAGTISVGTKLTVPAAYKVNGGQITDSFSHGDLNLTAAGVIMNSSNIGISLLSETLDKQSRHDYMTKFGIGSETGIGFLGESAGTLRDAADWDPITDKTVQFGQGVTATSVQVASLYQTIGNGGVKVPLTLVENCTNADGTVTDTASTEGTQVVSESAADDTISMMETVVTDGWLSNVLTIPGYRVAAKTGTAEVAANDGSGYTSDRIVSVAGLAPADDPQYAVVVTLGKPDTIKTSGAAAPTFTEIMTQVLKKYRVVPSGTPAPSIPLTW
ncbi:cell division protein FtsI (penicillin-binding protein 3) [Glaciihabitans tibetensis]|uniref:Cell division protein FtsI (Penicillin-binding protein 3) n=1 Tax=Glaciihabitans tibetensis TaxID=1266600 RepID=A0A2T0VEJ2_9MICO|nr:penicillin-binding protein 2 [Glaciihabitans tibetensis]PRY68532.1 cell division protein FtsI (penicillin-binding protein 3) [Glaciihabitans tibetensis]